MSEAGPSSEVEVIDLTGVSDSGSERDDDDEHEEEGSEEGSDTSEIEIVLNETTRAQLQDAIATVSESRLRQVLKNLVQTEVMVEAALTREFITLKRGTHDVVGRWECCANCGDEYDVNTLREEDECVFHPGDLEVDEDSFADHDEACHGPMDTAQNRRDFPQNFTWSCCGEDGTSSGCVTGSHRPQVLRKRKRVEDN
ncbi:hypothetical protein CVT24_004865 [Panaeolus cyanescens]|uniref:C2H2-type domain-containing protein n=1 Tax=Panaeolus cyanescens TaxID=181874 RepID=A0A409V9X1_9AGAR|nr:hypothetical protein CVT24_004865 [Panaeolus cyanescens]